VPPDAQWAIDSVCQHAGITRSTRLAGEGGILPVVEWAARYYDEPPREFISLYNGQLYDAAAASGVRLLLSGFGGNHGVSADGSGRRRELLWRGEWIELWRELSAGRHPVRAALRLVLAEFDGPRTEALLRRTQLWQAYPTRPAQEAFARRLRMGARTYQASRVQYSVRQGTLPEQTIRMLARPLVPLRLEYAHVSTTARRIEYRYPLLDVDLIAFYLAIPSCVKYWRGTDRYLFRRALEPWLPDDVRLSKATRTSANPGSMRRKLLDEEALKARVNGLAPDSAVFRYLDADKLRMPPRVRGRIPRERHDALLMALLLEQKLRGAARQV
jgi:hypothetical protein